jgi:hypothetical protein
MFLAAIIGHATEAMAMAMAMERGHRPPVPANINIQHAGNNGDSAAVTPQLEPGKSGAEIAVNFGPSGTFLPWHTLSLALFICLAYWLTTVIVRWNRIAHPTREMLRAQINALGHEIDILRVPDRLGEIKKLLEESRDLVDDKKQTVFGWCADVLFWSRGKELTGWGYVHEAEIQMAAFLPPATVQARLETAERTLRSASEAVAVALADSVHTSLIANYLTEAARQDRLRALLAEALAANYDREDSSFADLLSWQNKTAWLIAVGLLMIVVITAWDAKHSVLFLVGALGGLLSRLSRSLERKDVPTDYGASWTTLFLSPVAGALGAWAGLLLSGLAVRLNVLGTSFEGLLSTPPNDIALAAALAFGFSERLFDGVLDKLVNKTIGEPTAGSKSPPSPAGSPAPAVTPGPAAPPLGPAALPGPAAPPLGPAALPGPAAALGPAAPPAPA